MTRDLTDSETFDFGESTNNSDQPTGDQQETERFAFSENTMLVIHDGLWDLCPPYDLELVRGNWTVASCGNHGYEEPTQALRISAEHGDDNAMLPWYEFIFYDGSHAPVNLTGAGAITWQVSTAAGQHVWSTTATVISATAGHIQVQLLQNVALAEDAVGSYIGRFYLANFTRSVPTRPIELEVIF